MKQQKGLLQDEDTLFINAVNQLAEEYGFTVCWEKTDMENRILELDCGGDSAIISRFLIEMTEKLGYLLED